MFVFKGPLSESSQGTPMNERDNEAVYTISIFPFDPLLDRYPVGDWPRESKFTLGETAARSGRPHVTSLLLRNGLNPNERGERGETPLHHAAR